MKKIIAFFSILLILPVSLIPCFATVNYVTNIISPDYGFINGNHIGRNNNSGGVYFSSNVLSSGHYYYFKYTYISGEFTRSGGNFIYYRSGTYYPTVVPTSESRNTYDNIFDISNPDNRCFIINYEGDLLFDFLLVDLTELYGADIPDLETVRSDLAFFQDTRPYYQKYNSVSSPILAFYQGLSNSWNWFLELGQTGYLYQPAIFLAFSVGSAIIVYIVILIIKRCKK